MITSSPQVVSLLLDRKANVEHRAKTGLTPLMEAASGGYTEVRTVKKTMAQTSGQTS